MISVVVGGQYGDEGKGKITSYLASTGKYQAIARAGTGPNAGHTVVYNDKIYKLRLMPSGFFSNAKIFIGAGVLIDRDILFKEIEMTDTAGRFYVDKNTGVIDQKHVDAERADEYLMKTIGSTGSGCGTANVDRVNRKLKVASDYDDLRPYVTDVSEELNDILDNGGSVLVEGSQATFLSLYHGGYPFTTSKDVCAAACLSDVGLGPTRCDDVILVLKSFVTRVGTGPLKDELSIEEATNRGWQEYGTVTNRPRRSAPFDFDLAKKAVRLNGATSIALTKLDIVFPEIIGITSYEKVPREVKDFVKAVEKQTGIGVRYLSTGPGHDELIKKTII